MYMFEATAGIPDSVACALRVQLFNLLHLVDALSLQARLELGDVLLHGLEETRVL